MGKLSLANCSWVICPVTYVDIDDLDIQLSWIFLDIFLLVYIYIYIQEKTTVTAQMIFDL